MNIDEIKELAIEFRIALDAVVSKRQYGRLSIVRLFPKECCRYTSDLLAEYLINQGVTRERICMVESETLKYKYTHCWLVIDNEFCLDITADQFNNEFYFNKYTPISSCCISYCDTYLYKLFDNKKTMYIHDVGINSYNGDIPYKLRVVYDAVNNEIRNNR